MFSFPIIMCILFLITIIFISIIGQDVKREDRINWATNEPHLLTRKFSWNEATSKRELKKQRLWLLLA